LIVTVQLAVPGPVTVAGVQLRLVTCNGCVEGDTVSPVVVVLPFSPAVSVALTVVDVDPAEAMKVAKFCPVATVTLAGTVTVALLLDSETAVPPEGAFPLIVTVQLAVPGPVTVAGVQLRLVTCNDCVDGDTLSPVVVVLPFSAAVRVALTAVAVPRAEAGKIAKFCPVATVTLAGTVTVALLLDSKTAVPPEGAFPLIVTVQLAVPGPITVAGVQLRLVTCSSGGDTVSPVVVVLPFSPAVSVAFTVVTVDPAETVKVLLACPPATITLPGTVTVALLLDSETAVPPEGAFPFIVTIQLVVPGPVTVAGVQLRLVTCSSGGDTISPVVVVLPFRPAVSVALTVVDVDAAEAVKVLLVWPAATVRLAGTVTVALLLDSETTVPPIGALPLIVTVQLDVPGPVTVAGAQLKLVTCSSGGDTVSPVVVVLPFSPADSVAFAVVDVDAAEAVKVLLAWPAATVTLAGTVTVALLLDSETTVPPIGALPLIVTVQLDVPGPVTVPGVQLREPTVSGAGSVMVPLDAVVGIECPNASDVDTPEIERENEVVADDATCSVTEAKAPFETTVEFIPKTRQVIDPAELVQSSDFPAAEAAAPTDALIELTLAAGKVSVH
jgi:hypothetical protein